MRRKISRSSQLSVMTMTLSLLVAAVTTSTLPAEAKDARAIEHARVMNFWTAEKIAQAIPRDKFFEVGKLLGSKNPGGGSNTTTITGASWTNLQDPVVNFTGKVFFAMGGGYWVCSGSLVDDGGSLGRSIILTAGHCVVDETTGAFATNWMFIPNYDAKPANLKADGSFCASTLYGCWVADSLIASNAFASAGGFTLEAINHDYAFAVVSMGGLSANDNKVLDESFSWTNLPQLVTGSQVPGYAHIFGYPAAGKYNGTDLVYSAGPLSLDYRTSNSTYQIASSMTGGASGGPWYVKFADGPAARRIFSVTSYGYNGVQALFGPILNDETLSMFTKAKTTTYTWIAFKS